MKNVRNGAKTINQIVAVGRKRTALRNKSTFLEETKKTGVQEHPTGERA